MFCLFFLNVNVVFFVFVETNVKNHKCDLFFMGKLRSAVFDLYIQYIPVLSLYKW